MKPSIPPPISVTPATADDFGACESILRSLPDWFGIEESVDQYVAELPELQTLTAWRGDELLGFLALKHHNRHTVEIIVMAVRAENHRQGIGRALVESATRIARSETNRFVEVKTLGPSHPDPHYARTRRFYEALGFIPLEEIDELWPGNPCLIMVKVLVD